MGPFIIAIIILLVIVATSVALWWWRISAKIAPYQDEIERDRARGQKPAEEHVVVVAKRGPLS